MRTLIEAPEIRADKTDLPPKKRVWGFRAPARSRIRKSASQVSKSRRENRSAATTIALGRWFYLQPDPLGLRGGMNLYVYAMGNPVNRTDPKGLRVCGADGSWSSEFIPDEPWGYNFTECCQQHDDCYGCEGKSAGKSKRDCDLQFCLCMVKQCLRQASFVQGFRPCPSFGYCMAVVLGGDKAFEKARK